MSFETEVEKIILEKLQKTNPAEMSQGIKPNDLIDASTKVMGFKKLTKKGYTP